jgi:hypothetical protein
MRALNGFLLFVYNTFYISNAKNSHFDSLECDHQFYGVLRTKIYQSRSSRTCNMETEIYGEFTMLLMWRSMRLLVFLLPWTLCIIWWRTHAKMLMLNDLAQIYLINHFPYQFLNVLSILGKEPQNRLYLISYSLILFVNNIT